MKPQNASSVSATCWRQRPNQGGASALQLADRKLKKVYLGVRLRRECGRNAVITNGLTTCLRSLLSPAVFWISIDISLSLCLSFLPSFPNINYLHNLSRFYAQNTKNASRPHWRNRPHRLRRPPIHDLHALCVASLSPLPQACTTSRRPWEGEGYYT